MITTSPGDSAYAGTAAPASACSHVVRGNITPTWRNAHCTSPEQSQVSGPVAPHSYIFPICVFAAARAPRPLPVGSGRPADPLALSEPEPEDDPLLLPLLPVPDCAQPGAAAPAVTAAVRSKPAIPRRSAIPTTCPP